MTTTAAVAASSPVAVVRSCQACNLRLQHRAGPFAIRIIADDPNGPSGRIVIRGAVVNAGSHPVPGSVSAGVLHVLAPSYKSIEPVSALPPRGAIGSHASWAFTASPALRFGKPGIYVVNVTYGNVDSNTLTFSVR